MIVDPARHPRFGTGLSINTTNTNTGCFFPPSSHCLLLVCLVFVAVASAFSPESFSITRPSWPFLSRYAFCRPARNLIPPRAIDKG
ncbi:hypothetical protein BO70DRAFT_48827 [Aspergillus heteromorphus CBS 117.55]|uniref:Uncharacterized protein n=1 Tax=Aspergillus heteromorphus CBS 117.55 TaxID=1448321 RepID=A0A317W269_9EURO|nr:uncharacterized protein BO70DRAFT_48827 [Aspergillus heteromorphus CBS 117.55]PWY80726.1 hypothetical protein BO70DRAFT_48827 [Aspergillus heteromorphus CBS 117.55]